jgi:hypothetical protein
VPCSVCIALNVTTIDVFEHAPRLSGGGEVVPGTVIGVTAIPGTAGQQFQIVLLFAVAFAVE